MYQFATPLIENISLIIGALGVVVIVIGTVRALLHFCWNPLLGFTQARFLLGSHLLLGLDLFVGKDIIDATFLPVDDLQWIHLASLVTIVGVRVLLTYFLLRELEEIELERERLVTINIKSK